MSEIQSGFRKILSNPRFYSLVQDLLGGTNYRKTLISNYIRPSPGMCLLDVGCGPAEILEFLPDDLDYIGFDVSQKYIDQALKHYGERGRFFQGHVSDTILVRLGMVDIVMAIGVLHHLEDDEVLKLSALAHQALKPGGRFLTVDPCYLNGQPWIAQYLISKDRGQNVRSMDGYKSLIEEKNTWETTSGYIRHDLLRLPYTHAIIECRK